jgi:hypothetical protein
MEQHTTLFRWTDRGLSSTALSIDRGGARILREAKTHHDLPSRSQSDQGVVHACCSYRVTVHACCSECS